MSSKYVGDKWDMCCYLCFGFVFSCVVIQLVTATESCQYLVFSMSSCNACINASDVISSSEISWIFPSTSRSAANNSSFSLSSAVSSGGGLGREDEEEEGGKRGDGGV